MNLDSDKGEDIKINPDFLIYFQEELKDLSSRIFNSFNRESEIPTKKNSSTIKNIKSHAKLNIDIDISNDEIKYLKNAINYFSNK
jgi:hypothetical protein